MPGFWLMELDLVFLEGGAVSSRRFWSVCGLSMPLGSPGFPVLGAPIFAAVSKRLSAYMQCSQSLLVPGITAGDSVAPSHPALPAETS